MTDIWKFNRTGLLIVVLWHDFHLLKLLSLIKEKKTILWRLFHLIWIFLFQAAIVARFPPPSSSSAPHSVAQRCSSATSPQPMAPHHTLPTAQYETVQLSPPPQLSPLSPPARAASMEVTASPASLHPPQLLVPEPPSSTEVTYLSAQTQVHKPSAPRPSSPALSLQSSPALSLLSNSPWTPPLRHRQRHNHVARHLFS